MRNIIVGRTVRPGRVAVLVDVSDAHWQGTCLRVIQYYTKMWGGMGNIIIPTDGNTIAPIFWKVLERFDPDYLYGYRRSWRDVERDEPETFAKVLGAHHAAWRRDIGSDADEFQSAQIHEDLERRPASKFEISVELQQHLKERLAPFYFQEHVVHAGWLSAGTGVHYPHTAVIDLLGHAPLPPRIVRVVTGEGARLPPLWWAALIGCADMDLTNKLREHGVTETEIGSNDPGYLRALIGPAMTRRERVLSGSYWREEIPISLPEILATLPDNFSMAALGHFRDSRAIATDWQEWTVAVAGNGIEDFALYFALSRMRQRVVWIPPSLTAEALSGNQPQIRSDESTSFRFALSSLASGDGQREPGLQIVSLTLPTEGLDRVRKYVETALLGGHAPIEIADPIDCIPRDPIRYYDSENAGITQVIAMDDEGRITHFDTPLPRNFGEVVPQKHRWLTELWIEGNHLPRHHELGTYVLGAPHFTTGEVRVSSIGPTYFCPSIMLFGGASAESSVPKPDIRMPGPLSLFERIAGAANLLSRTSDKGVYAQTACDKFGGLSELASFLRSSGGIAFVNAYLDLTKPDRGDHSRGCVLGGRRFHNLESLAIALGNRQSATRTLDDLSRLSVVHRGFALKCQHCRHADWYPFADLNDSFQCRRCRRTQIFTRKHWLYPDQPEVYYELDELTYLGLRNDMHVPILALDHLKRKSRQSFLFVQELEFLRAESQEKLIEVDINCVIDGALTIGEAKRQDCLARSDKEECEIISRYAILARELCASRIVFATQSPGWRQATIDRIERLADAGRFEVTLLGGNDLYSTS